MNGMTINPVYTTHQVINTLEEIENNEWRDGGAKTLLQLKESLFVHNNKIALVSANQWTGVNRKSGKRWFRWETQRSQGIRRTHKGTLVPFAVTKEGRRFRPMTRFDAFEPHVDPMMQLNYISYVNKQFNVSKLSDIYPVLGLYGLDEMWNLPQGMHRFFRLPNERDFTKAVFGKHNYRRDLLKAVCNASPNKIALVREFNGLVPVDWQITWLRDSNALFDQWYGGCVGLKRILTQLDPRSYRRLLQDNDMHAGNFVHDIVNNRLDGIEPIYVRSFEELHNEVWGGRFYRPAVVENKPIEQLPLAEVLHGLTIDKLRITTAQETDDLTKWGERMSNCIAGYSRTALVGDGIYGAVELDGKVIANYEIRENSLRQLLGRFNRPLPPETKSKVVLSLMDKGVDCNGNWWGK
jgi:hypothetical protein